MTTTHSATTKDGTDWVGLAREIGRLLRELGRHDGATAVALSMHMHLVAAQVWRYRQGMDVSAFFRKVVGDRAFLISTGASDWIGSSGSARKVDGGYRVSARKAPASGCEAGQLLVTSVRWDAVPEGPRVLHFALPLSAEGVRIERTWDTLGLRATGSHTVVLEEVFVPDAAVSLDRPADVWHPVWNVILGAAMPLILAAYVGIADAAVERTVAAAMGRAEPHRQQLLGEMLNAHTTAADVVDATGYGPISGEYFSLGAGTDIAPLLQGLGGDLCQAPHWGYVLQGELTVTFADGTQELPVGGDLFYWPPGHTVKVGADAEVILFSPQKEHSEVIDHMLRKMAA